MGLFNREPSGDWTRVCAKCGTAWLLPKEWATEKAPNARQVKAMERASRIAVGRQRTRYSMQSSALSDQQTRVLSNGRCPSCGSGEYTQYRPGETPV